MQCDLLCSNKMLCISLSEGKGWLVQATYDRLRANAVRSGYAAGAQELSSFSILTIKHILGSFVS